MRRALSEAAADDVAVPRQWSAWLIALVLPILVAAVYWPGLGGGFAFDDFPNIVNNAALHITRLAWDDWLAATFSSPSSDLQRPVAMLSFAVNHYFTGLDPWPMKLTNVAIHAVNSLLVFALVRRLVSALPRQTVASSSSANWIALFASACWALNPINLTAVLFVVQRMESLSHCFVFAGLWLYMVGRQRQLAGRNGWVLIGSALLFATGLGVLAKESAVLLPLYAFLLELCLLGFRNSDGRRDRNLYVLFAAVLFVPALLGLAWLWPHVSAADAYATREYTMVERLLTEPRVVLDYLRWTLLPDLGQLSLYHDDYQVSRSLFNPISTTIALVVLSGLAALAWRVRASRRLTALGVFWFLGAQVLTATIIPLELVYEHRNYFASLGICLALADLLLIAPAKGVKRRIGILLAMVALLAFSVTTHMRAREWSSPYRFAVSEAAKHPASPRATYALGQILVIMSDYDVDSPFVEPARQALEHARKLPGSGILPDSALLMLAARTHAPQKDEWWQQIQDRLRKRPIGPQEVSALASLETCVRDQLCSFAPGQVISTFEAALTHGRHPDVLSIYGEYILRVMGNPQLALILWREASAKAPRVAQYRINLIKLLISVGHYQEAREEIDRLRKLGRVGSHEGAAAELERRLDAASEQPVPPN